MAGLAVRFFPSATAKRVADFEPLVTIGLFCGLGLLISISTIVVQQYVHAKPIHESIAPKSIMLLEDVQAKVDVNKLANLEFEDQSFVFSTPVKR